MKTVSITSVLLAGAAVKSFDVIAHRGYPGKFPEETLVGYEALNDIPEVNFYECDIVLSKDSVLFCTHEPQISATTTNVEENGWVVNGNKHSPYAEQVEVTCAPGTDTDCDENTTRFGLFFKDFTAEEIESGIMYTHRMADRDYSPDMRYQKPLRYKELLQLSIAQGRGIYIEPKHSAWHFAQGLDVNGTLIKETCEVFGCTFEKPADGKRPEDIVASFGDEMGRDLAKKWIDGRVIQNVSNEMRNFVHLHQSFEWVDSQYMYYAGWPWPLVALVDNYDCAYENPLPGCTFEDGETIGYTRVIRDNDINNPQWDGYVTERVPLTTSDMLAYNAPFTGVETWQVLNSKNLIRDAHAAGISVHVWTLTNEKFNMYVEKANRLAEQCSADGTPEFCDITKARVTNYHLDSMRDMYDAMIEAGVDGIFTDDAPIIAEWVREDGLANGAFTFKALVPAFLVALALVAVVF